MFKRHSIFIKVLIPVIIVMLFQTLLISLVLYANGTIDSLDDSAIESMRKNTENRSITLEDMMVHYWSSLDKLETEIAEEIDAYLKENDLSISDALGSYEHETNMIYRISEFMLSTLRLSSSTGVYMYFAGGEEYTESAITCNGLYYRDLDPVSTPADYSDILFLRGFVDIARKDKIQLDSLWNEIFTFSPEYPEVWNSFSAPRLAAMEYPQASSADLSYWSKPIFINPESRLDTNKCVTYTRPLIYDGRLIAMLGTEVQLSRLERYFPASDFDSSGKSGYMLVKYDRESADTISCSVYAVTGSYIKRIIATDGQIDLALTHRDGVYTAASDDGEGVQIVFQPLRLYNTNAPFSNEQWALAAIGADSVLFESSRNVSSGILYSSLFALIAGSLLIAFIIRLSTKPLISIADQIEESAADDPIVISNSNTYEIVLLCSTINAMRQRRGRAEAQLLEERERYLIALESAADTFMEYDIAQDRFMLYYFSEENKKSQLCSKVIPGFMDYIYSGEFCHQDDIHSLTAFISSESAEPIEIRARVSLFSHIAGAEPDGEYYWFLLKASRIYGDDGGVTKMIGIAREITREKLSEYARIETARRDCTTGLYNRDYGVQLIKNSAYLAAKDETPFSISLISVDNFDNFEAYYGRVFGGVLLMGVSHKLLDAAGAKDVVVRLSNDEFLFYFSEAGKKDVETRAGRIYADISQLYMGENADLRLNVSIGTAQSSGAGSYYDLIQNAYRAARYAVKSGGGRMAFYDELPPQEQKEAATGRDKPVSVFLDISKESIVGFAFELFERTADVHSAIKMLLSVLGGMFSMRQIIVCSYDNDFGATSAAYQWNEKSAAGYHGNIEKVSYRDLSDFEMLLDENGALLYDEEIVNKCADGVRRLLCAFPGEEFSAYCCAIYENGIHTGRIIFKSTEPDRVWSDAELISLYEITKIIAARLSIEKSNSASRAKSEFLSRISHEIRTPMNAIIGMTDIAKNSTHDSERLKDCLGKIDFSAKHLLSLINDVLEMSRIESGKLKIAGEPFSLTDFVTGIETLMRPPIEGKEISFIIENNSRHTEVIGDEYRLRQVLVNLLGNANKFTDPGGVIVFSIKERDEIENTKKDFVQNITPDGEYGYFTFSVKDNGIGISQEDQPHVFKAFEQADSSTSTHKHQGTGLGLAISGNIISMMGSKIELTSKAGEGSNFFFTLKLKLGDGQVRVLSPEQDQNEQIDSLTGKRALLAEDNEINIEIASYILEEAGMQYDIALNGKEAVDKFLASGQGYYDIILMDIQMPVMDGLTATRNIRKNAERSDARTIPIVAMTANAFDEDMKKSIESGMNGHIAKPIDNEKLYTLLRQLMNNKEPQS